ncbi:F-box/kelch-repeat protein At3g23880-like isoform X1 [Silene latifolia]|uniref:F-box/kelch-repeat protein At3g23880-like isoform X1 n=1 Tax=Silene latifolia TaxID=37657 RepID=UPI003D77C2D0
MPTVVESKKQEMESQSKDEKDLIQQFEQRELPHDLISEMILTRLPIKSILRFKSVSKLWYSTLSSSLFAFAHFKFPNPSLTESLLIRNGKRFQIMSYKNGEIDLVNVEVDFDVGDENMDLVGTCNGLVCLGSSSGRLSIIWNPITREFRKYLDSENSDFFLRRCSAYWGFGYDSTADDYKIVRICKNLSNNSSTVHVCSIKLDTWRIIKNDAYDDTSHLRNPVFVRISGALVNETLYWRLPGTNFSFNLASEKLEAFPYLEVSPSLSYVTTSDDEYVDKLLFVVNGCLSMYGNLIRGGDIITFMNILTIMKSPEVIEQMIVPKDLAKSMHHGGNLIGFTRSDKIFTQYMACLGVIDLTQQPLNITPLMDLERSGKSEIVNYCASLIPPNISVL